MPDIIDVLQQSTDTDTPNFTVNLAVTNVTMVLPALGLLRRGDGLDTMQRLDHFQILSIGFAMPLSFEPWENDVAGDFRGINIDLDYKDTVGGALTPLDPGVVWMPFANYELNLGNFVQLNPALIPSTFKLYMNFNSVVGQKVSMVGVNAALDGLKFYVPLFMKILHTLPMT